MRTGAAAAVVAAGGGIAWAATRGARTGADAAAAGSAEEGIPRILAESASSGEGLVRPDSVVDLVGVRGGDSVPDGAVIRFETADGMTEWTPLRFHAGGPDGRPAEPMALVSAPKGCTGYEVSTERPAPVDCAAMNVRDGEPVRISGQREGELYTDTDTATESDGVRRVEYLTRAGWGADESLRFNDDGSEEWPAEFSPVQTITVHHSALDVAGDPAASVRAIYHMHAVEEGWGDIGYHLLVDAEGRVYEGRVSGEDGLPIFAEPPLPGAAECVTAGHVTQMNSGNIGVCLLGDFTEEPPTDAALDSLVDTLNALCAMTGVDPHSEVEYVNPVNGDTATQMGVSLHRDWLETACPGDAFAPRFDELVRGRLVAGGGV